jgi:uncharacterized damage-inducible protein DinB
MEVIKRMESLDSIMRLFDYDYWASQEALRSIATISAKAERALKVAGHLIGALRVWLARFEAPELPPPAPWPLLSLEEAEAAVSDMRRRWDSLLHNLTPERLDGDLVYRNSKGVEFRTPARHVLMHLVMHSAYHRGQIAAAVREAGGKPAATDYIVYVRQLQKG